VERLDLDHYTVPNDLGEIVISAKGLSTRSRIIRSEENTF
jgi:hypothetical protein